MKTVFIALATLVTFSAFGQTPINRVPYVFTGNSPAQAYANFSRYRNKKDTRDSRKYPGYYLNTSLVDRIKRVEGISSVHFVTKNIAREGLCPGFSQCFRVFVYLNGNQNTGDHVATFVASPGTGSRTPLTRNGKLRVFTRSLTRYERPTQFGNFDMYRIYGSKSYPSAVPNMPNAMFYLPLIAIHGSFDKVNGAKQSKGCIRMFPDESYWAQSLARLANGRVTFDVFHTR